MHSLSIEEEKKEFVLRHQLCRRFYRLDGLCAKKEGVSEHSASSDCTAVNFFPPFIFKHNTRCESLLMKDGWGAFSLSSLHSHAPRMIQPLLTQLSGAARLKCKQGRGLKRLFCGFFFALCRFAGHSFPGQQKPLWCCSATASTMAITG